MKQHILSCEVILKMPKDISVRISFLWKNVSIWNGIPKLVYLFAVFWIGKMYKIIIVHLLGIDDVTVFFLTEILWVNSIGS